MILENMSRTSLRNIFELSYEAYVKLLVSSLLHVHLILSKILRIVSICSIL